MANDSRAREGRVVVDAGGSTHCAMLGDKMAEIAVSNGWAGLVSSGVIRVVDLVDQLEIGIKALGSNPCESHKHGSGERDVVVASGGAIFTPGHLVVSDRDGVVVIAL